MGPKTHGGAGKREYVQVLRLMESFRLEQVDAAVRDALRLGDQLRCGQALGALSHRATAAAVEPGSLSLPAPRPGGRHLGQELPEPAVRGGAMSETPQLLLAHHLKKLKLPTFLRDYDKVARQCACQGRARRPWTACTRPTAPADTHRTIAQAATGERHRDRHRAQIPIEPARSPRFRALALLRRLKPPRPTTRASCRASEKPAQQQKSPTLAATDYQRA